MRRGEEGRGGKEEAEPAPPTPGRGEEGSGSTGQQGRPQADCGVPPRVMKSILPHPHRNQMILGRPVADPAPPP